MKNNIIISGLIAMLLTSGCGNDNQNSTQQIVASDTLQKTPLVKNESEEEAMGTLVLNNGDKWQANPETIKGVVQMQKLANDYLVNTNANDIKELGDNLEKEFSGILEKCTMTGEAHTQLHNYLLPLRDKIEGLKNSHKIEKVKDIQSYLAEFKIYFQ